MFNVLCCYASFLRKVSSFASIEARNASLTGHSRKRRANDGPKQVQSTQPTPDRSDEDDDDDDDDNDNSDDLPDDDDDFWDDEENREFQDPAKKEPRFLKSEQMSVLMATKKERLLSTIGHLFEDMVLSCTYRGVPCR